MIEYAKQALSAGLCVLPPKEGDKPPCEDWSKYQSSHPSDAKLREWYDKRKLTGIGYVCGTTSGNLEVMDFDIAEYYDKYMDALEHYDCEMAEKFMSFVETSPKGMHVYYRCDHVGKNRKLASVGGKVAIEIRGEGGYIVAAPTVRAGKQYRQIRGDFSTIPVFTADERDELHRIARECFDEVVDAERIVRQPPVKKNGSQGKSLRPGDDFNARHTIEEVIQRFGWTFRRNRRDGVTEWTRPGSRSGECHATSGHKDIPFYNFSSNAYPLEPDTGYDAFALFTLYEHGGDFSEAASELAGKGYGSKTVPEIPKYMQPKSAFSSLIYDFCDLQTKELPEPVMFTPFLPEGLTVLAGAPKIGKSWFCLGLCAAAISDGQMKVFEHFPISHVKCLYLALEDGERRIKKRSRTVMKPPLQFQRHINAQKGWFRLAHSWPKMTAGGLSLLDEYLTAEPECKVVIIDTLAKIKAGGSKGKNAYENDYDIISEIKKLADKYHAAVILITHLNKSHGDYNDILEEITGSMGISGAADTIMVLKRPRGKEKGADAEFHVTGRDIEEQTYSLQFNEGLWYYQGDLSAFNLTKKQSHVVEALQNIGKEAWPKEIGQWVEQHHNEKIGSIYNMLTEMEQEGLVKKNARGYYLK